MADSIIHPTAVVHPSARLGAGVEVGPFCVIDSGVVLGDGCRLGPAVHLTGETEIGSNNIFHTGCVIGDAPQDLKYHGTPTRLRIGKGNVFREHFTVHRSNKIEEATVMGSNGFFMANSHVGHNAEIGDHVILANGALVAGHVKIGDRAFISGNCLLHQFVRVGRLALMQGGAAISKDLPPFTIARGDNGICGLNGVGLRRNGFSSADRNELRALYQALFRGTDLWRTAWNNARSRFASAASVEMLDFCASSQRGLCRDTGLHGVAPPEDQHT